MIDRKLKGINTTHKTLASGKVRTYYFHRATKMRLPDDPNSHEFLLAYTQAEEAIKSTGRNRGTLKALIQEYVSSPEFTEKRERTRKDYRKQIVKIENKFGTMPIDALDDPKIRQLLFKWRDQLAVKSKKQADYAVTVLGVILSWALDRGHIVYNHAAKIGKLYKSNRSSITWLPEAIDAFSAHATPELQLALILARDTGQRQGDLLRLMWSAYDGSYIRITQSKTGSKVEVPVTDELKALLDNQDRTSTTILTRPDGRPWKVDHFRHAWREVTKMAGLDGLRFQDLRGTTVTALADAGCTTFEIAAITGHTLKSVESILEHYVARTRAQADSAIIKLENARRTNSANRVANHGEKQCGDQK